MAATYLDIRHSHYRITLRGWLRGIGKAVIAAAAALQFMLTALVVMLVIGLAQALLQLSDPAASFTHRAAVIVAWQSLSFVLLRAVREAALMPAARGFFDTLPVRPAENLRADAVLSLLTYSFLWLPVAWVLADPMAQRAASLAATIAELGELVILGLAVNLAWLRGARLHGVVATAALLGFALLHARGLAPDLARAACAVLAAVTLWKSYLPGAARASRPRRRGKLADRAALASGFVLPMYGNALRASVAIRVVAILATLAGCLLVIDLRTNDTSTASVLLFVAAVATLALHPLPALCRTQLLERLGFLAGQPAFTRRMRLMVYAIPTALFVASLALASLFDRSGRAGVDATVLAALYVLGVTGTRLGWRATSWFIPFLTLIAVIVLGAMT